MWPWATFVLALALAGLHGWWRRRAARWQQSHREQIAALAERQAETELQDLLIRYPNFEKQGRTFLGRYLKEKGLLEHVCAGFEKIGVTLS